MQCFFIALPLVFYHPAVLPFSRSGIVFLLRGASAVRNTSAVTISLILVILFMSFLLATGSQFAAEGISIHPDRSTAFKDARININTASAEELELLPGIGPALSAAIIEHRKNAGAFRRIEDLMEVSGIGEKKFEAIRGMIYCNEMEDANANSDC